MNTQLSPEQVANSAPQDVLDHFAVDPQQGLSDRDVERQRQRFGHNRLEEAKQRGAGEILIDQFKSPIIGLLAFAAVLAFLFQDWVEGIAVVVAILLNALIGFTTEIKAVQSMESLKQLSQSRAKVRRNGQVQEIAAEDLVPGDLVLLEGGDLVAADLRLLEVSNLNIDESPLTGESVPVLKSLDPVDPEAPLAEQTNRAFKGTAVTQGSGEGIVTAIGMKTELGHISELAQSAGGEQTPLEKRLDELGRRLIWITLVIAAVVALSGIVRGKDLLLMVETAIALSVAAVPEGLPIVATVALARGMWRMAKRNALINRLSAVETLGATSIICTDKTGTLTQNQMTVTQIAIATGQVTVEKSAQANPFVQNGEPLSLDEHAPLKRLVEVGVLCVNAALNAEGSTENAVGDPMEVALLKLGTQADLRRDDLLQQFPEDREVAFDPDTKMMATFHETDRGYRVAVKGAPESVLAACTQQLTPDGVQPFDRDSQKTWQAQMMQMAEQGLRTLAMAEKNANSSEADPYTELTLLGIVGLEDPPREGVYDAIKACHKAGIRVIMVTGDQPVTAQNIGKAVGLVSDTEDNATQGKALRPLDDLTDAERQQLQQVSVFARVSPEQKLNLIALHQHHGAIVAMTGDGVNDAPALQKADIGVAMGQRGTQVAQEAADMVLQDDSFATIVAAIAQGRAIFRNIRQFTLYLLSGNTGEIIAVAVASLVNAPLPLLPLQILFLNAVNDVFPALALGVGEGNPAMMDRPPRRGNEAVLTRDHWISIGGWGVLIAVPVLAIFALALQVWSLPTEKAVTLSFLTLAFGRLWHVVNMRSRGTGVFKNEVTQNPYIWGAFLVCTGLLLMAVYLPGLSDVLGTVGPNLQEWGLILGFSLIPVVVGQLWLAFRR